MNAGFRVGSRPACQNISNVDTTRRDAMKTKFTRIAVAASVSGAMILSAGQAFAGPKTERALIGALIGGVAGVALSRNDTQGALIGAAAGAALGAATAKDNGHRYRTTYRDSRSYYGNTGGYRTYDRVQYDNYGHPVRYYR
jgi:hypothetical protein